MIKIGIMAFAIVIMAMVGPALAVDPTIEILPSSGPNVLPDGTIQVPVGVDASISVGLAADYKNFVAGNPYDIQVTKDSDLTTHYSDAGGLPSGGASDVVAVHWIPTPADVGQAFTITAEGTTSVGRRTWHVRATAPLDPIPELSTSILTATGMIGLLGMVILRKKN